MLKTILKNGSKIFSRRQSSIFSAATVLAVAFGASALLGILRDRLLYARFFACCADQLDAYNAAFRIPDIIFRLLVTGALSAAFIPVFSEQISKNKAKAYQTASSVINTLFLVFSVVSVLVIVFSYPLSRLIAFGFHQEQILLMSKLTRMMVVSQLFFLLSSFLTSILQTRRRFIIPALAPIVYNLGIIFGICVLSPHFGIFGPAIGVIIGAGLHFLIQLPLAFSLGFKYSFLISFRLEGVRKILRLMFPRTLALGLGEVEATLALFLATTLPTGTLSLFYLGQRLTQFCSRIFGVTIGQASLPVLSREAADPRLDSFKKTFFSSLLQAVYLAFPAAAIFLILRIPIVRLAYGSQEFPWKATLATGRIVALFAPLIVIGAVNDILIRAFYALQDTRTPLMVSLFSLITNFSVALYTVFGLNWGVLGLTTAITIAGTVRALLLIILLFKRIKVENWRLTFLGPFLKICFASSILALVTWTSFKLLDQYVFNTARIIELIALAAVSISISAPIYLLLTLILRLKEARAILSLFKKISVWLKAIAQPIELPPLLE